MTRKLPGQDAGAPRLPVSIVCFAGSWPSPEIAAETSGLRGGADVNAIAAMDYSPNRFGLAAYTYGD